MPSSALHCEDCLFAALPVGDEDTTSLEERYVEGHIQVIDGVLSPTTIDMEQVELPGERLIAARGCAKVVREGRCARFVGFVVHGGNNAAKTFILERDEYPEP